MEKRYQVFVSSTYEDLRVERQEVMQALLELDCIPSGMELFPAADDDQWTLIKRVIDDCDYYIVIIAGRYGSLGSEGISFTQMEYAYAISKQKPVMAFLHGDPGKIQADRTDPENRARLDAFREQARKKVCRNWTTPQELGSVVSRSVVKLIKDRPAIGWVRADLVPDESAAKEMLRLKTENEKLKLALEQARAEGPKGSEAFSFGDEEIELHFSFEFRGTYSKEVLKVTWNTLFAALGPLMIDGAYDSALKTKLEELFKNLKLDHSGAEVWSAYIRDEDFQQIKIQFRALGLITHRDATGSKGTAATLWILTPYGDTVLSQVAAIRSSDTKGR
jgi:hypothetical protein